MINMLPNFNFQCTWLGLSLTVVQVRLPSQTFPCIMHMNTVSATKPTLTSQGIKELKKTSPEEHFRII